MTAYYIIICFTKSRFLEVTACIINVTHFLSKFYKKNNLPRTQCQSLTDPRGPRTTVWKTLQYIYPEQHGNWKTKSVGLRFMKAFSIISSKDLKNVFYAFYYFYEIKLGFFYFRTLFTF